MRKRGGGGGGNEVGRSASSKHIYYTERYPRHPPKVRGIQHNSSNRPGVNASAATAKWYGHPNGSDFLTAACIHVTAYAIQSAKNKPVCRPIDRSIHYSKIHKRLHYHTKIYFSHTTPQCNGRTPALTSVCPWPSLAGSHPSPRETREPPETTAEEHRRG